MSAPTPSPSSGLDPRQFRDLIIRPVLSLLSLPSPRTSELLLMGTCAQESRFRYLKQLGGGPALGLFQMEPLTFHDLWNRIVLRTPLGREVQEFLVPNVPPLSQLIWNLHFSCAMCRVHYWARDFVMPQDPLPSSLSLPSPLILARIWKQHYNTEKGKGTMEEFIQNYRQLVEPIYL